MRKFSSTVFVLLFAWVLTLATPGAALAHDVLEKTTPGDGTTVAQLAPQVSLSFSDAPLAVGTQVLVTGPSGNMVDGAPTIEGRDVVQRLLPAAPAGDYVVTYRVTSKDGHPISGSFSFHATVGLDGSTATAEATVHVPQVDPPAETAAKDSQFVPVVLTIVAVLILVVLFGVVIWVASRRRGNSDAS